LTRFCSLLGRLFANDGVLGPPSRWHRVFARARRHARHDGLLRAGVTRLALRDAGAGDEVFEHPAARALADHLVRRGAVRDPRAAVEPQHARVPVGRRARGAGLVFREEVIAVGHAGREWSAR